jgi:MFS transporter, FHS family, glucose/mannose:H+ symporter
LHAGFALTGIGTTLFGCILPSLNSSWHLDDRRAGILFAAQFLGSSSGALFVSSDFFRSLLRGYLLMVASAIGLTFFTGIIEGLFFLAFGLGLGLSITSTSMMIGTASLPNRGAALSLLNAVWGGGAALSPVIASLWVRHWPPANLFFALGAAVLLTLVLIGIDATALVHSVNPNPNLADQTGSRGGHVRLISIFAVLGFLYVGTEVSVSGWMMTYVSRLLISSSPAPGFPLSPGFVVDGVKMWAPIATSCFWVALLCGRTLVPVVVRWLSEVQLLTWSLIAAFLAAVLLLLSRAPLAIVVSAILVGLTLAPIFPLSVAKVLALSQGSPQTKWMLAISGLGGAVLPWITGELSAHTGSLRIGLLVPAVALATMILLDRLESLTVTKSL